MSTTASSSSSSNPRPSPSHLSNRLRHLTQTSPPQSALLYSRIWHALSPWLSSTSVSIDPHEALHTLALAFLINGEPYSALHLVRDTAESSPRHHSHAGPSTTTSRSAAAQAQNAGCVGCAVIVAKGCEAVGRYSEGAKVLERALQRNPMGMGDVSLPTLQSGVSSSTHLLLARMSHKGKNTEVAAEHFTKALAEDPWLWEAFTGLCDMGLAPHPDILFPSPPSLSYSHSHSHAHSRASSSTTLRAPTHSTAGGGLFSASVGGPSLPMPRSSTGDASNFFGLRKGPSSTSGGAGGAGSIGSGATSPQLAVPMAGLSLPIPPGAGPDVTPVHAGLGMFTPDVTSVLGGKGAVGGRAVPMLGGQMWDTPSVMGDTTFSSAQMPRRMLPTRMGAGSGATSTGAAASSATVTPAAEAPSVRPPAMKRPRGVTRTNLETPVNGHGHPAITAPGAPRAGAGPASTGTGGVSEADTRRSQRDLKSIEPNGEADLPPRRSSRLKTTTSKPVSRLPRPFDKEKRSLHPSSAAGGIVGAGGLSRSRSATATSTAGSTTTDLLSPPLDGYGYNYGFSNAPPSAHELHLQETADEYLRSIIRSLARSIRSLSLYACTESISHLDTLPLEIQQSPIALDIIARAFYEQASYIRSKRAFTSLFQIEPYRLESAHIYSTLLWHLSDAPGLSALAQGLIGIDKERAESWIALGNCLALGGEHEGAMRCFKRASSVAELGQGQGTGTGTGKERIGTQTQAYAFTLCGYEAVEMEEYERAVGMYRAAIRTDPRLYNAWYGMGQVYMKMSKPRHAEHHFRRAAEINPSNAVLLCCIGTVLESLDDNRQALMIYERAARVSPESAMVAFKRIRMLVALGQIQDALNLLIPLANSSPDEAQVQLLLGKCLLRVDRRPEAIVALTNARELAPRLAGAVRATIEANGEEVESDDED